MRRCFEVLYISKETTFNHETVRWSTIYIQRNFFTPWEGALKYYIYPKKLLLTMRRCVEVFYQSKETTFEHETVRWSIISKATTFNQETFDDTLDLKFPKHFLPQESQYLTWLSPRDIDEAMHRDDFQSYNFWLLRKSIWVNATTFVAAGGDRCSSSEAWTRRWSWLGGRHHQVWAVVSKKLF